MPNLVQLMDQYNSMSRPAYLLQKVPKPSGVGPCEYGGNEISSELPNCKWCGKLLSPILTVDSRHAPKVIPTNTTLAVGMCLCKDTCYDECFSAYASYISTDDKSVKDDDPTCLAKEYLKAIEIEDYPSADEFFQIIGQEINWDLFEKIDEFRKSYYPSGSIKIGGWVAFGFEPHHYDTDWDGEEVECENSENLQCMAEFPIPNYDRDIPLSIVKCPECKMVFSLFETT